MSLQVLGLVGSLRTGSLNRRLLQAATHELPRGTRLELWNGLEAVPPYKEDVDTEPAPPAVAALRQAVAAADALLIATPEYNHSIPGQLKNVLDWLSRPWPAPPLARKPCAVIGASPSAYGASWAQAETRKVLRAIGARVIDADLPVARAPAAFAEHGRLTDQAHRARLAEILRALVAAAGMAAATGGEAVA